MDNVRNENDRFYLWGVLRVGCGNNFSQIAQSKGDRAQENGMFSLKNAE